MIKAILAICNIKPGIYQNELSKNYINTRNDDELQQHVKCVRAKCCAGTLLQVSVILMAL